LSKSAIAALVADAKYLEEFAYRAHILDSANVGLASLYQARYQQAQAAKHAYSPIDSLPHSLSLSLLQLERLLLSSDQQSSFSTIRDFRQQYAALAGVGVRVVHALVVKYQVFVGSSVECQRVESLARTLESLADTE